MDPGNTAIPHPFAGILPDVTTDALVVIPQSVDAAVDELARRGDRARILAGCTDLTTALRHSQEYPDIFIIVGNIGALRVIEQTGSKCRVGAAVTMTELSNSVVVMTQYAALADAAITIGGVQIRNAATVGGNNCNASPGADTPPALLALNAFVEIASHRGRREISLKDFFVGPRRTILQRDELVVSLSIPSHSQSFGSAYFRLTTRNALDLAVVGAAAALELEEDAITIASSRIALGAVAATPLLVPEAGETLVGKPATLEHFHRAAKYARDICNPIDDVRASAAYRREIVSVLVRRALAKATERAARKI